MNTITTISINELEKNKQNMTDVQWQEYLPQLRNQIKPVETTTTISRQARMSYIMGKRWCLSDNEYIGKSQDERYCDNINDVLKQIRGKRGRKDYVYNVYAICDLLKFEHNLQCTFVPDGKYSYFEVWLEKK